MLLFKFPSVEISLQYLPPQEILIILMENFDKMRDNISNISLAFLAVKQEHY